MIRNKNYIAIPPGETIREQMAERNISVNEISASMRLSSVEADKLLNGEISLTAEFAERL